ncbi:MAG TPA: pyroglutamyl-peptidase I [Methylomirabilota bacterium]|nr:pyroglutamyl-peptidase I [Methylomirabilota bacterium]
MVVVARAPADIRETVERAVTELEETVPRTKPEPVAGVRLVSEPVILVTGYEPFGTHSLNPSQELAKLLDGRRIGNCAVAGVVLPVHHREAARHVSVLLGEMAPVAVVHLGLAEGRSRLALERVALNVMDYRIPDNAGYRAEGEPCAAEGPAAYFASLPLPEMLAALTAEGIPAYVSNTAGTYLCNQILYSTLHEIALRELTARAGFIHLPLLPAMVAASGLDQPSMDFALMLRGVETALGVVAETVAR